VDAGVVDQAVDAPAARGECVERRAQRRFVVDVAGEVHHALAQLLVERDALDAGALARQAADDEAAPRQLDCDGRADSAARAGDRDDLGHLNGP